MADMPLVSIVTPSFNQGRFLRRTIESVLGQSYPNIEYFVIDGGSRDESGSILQSYGNRFYWVCEPDKGQADAINKGFARSHGKIRAYLNSDDVLLPDAVATVVRHLQEHPGWDLVYGRAYFIDEDDRITGRYDTAEFDFARLMEECMICQPAAFWRTRVAERIGPFNDCLQYTMDYDYWIRLARAGGRLVHVPEYLAAWRLHPAIKTRAARGPTYRELFATCLREAGFVSYSHFHAYWHHLCHERWRLLGWLPGFQHVISVLHYKWYHERRPWPLFKELARGAISRLRTTLSLGQRRVARDDRHRGAKPINGSADDAAGIAGALAHGIKSDQAG